MAVAWTIQGEAGKAWDASTLTFEQRKIENARFEFKSLDADTFTFRVSAQTIASETLPDYTQKIVIYRDGVRFFTGHVTNRQVQIDSGSQICDVTVSGPWWWMERITFTATNTDATGATAERATLAFGGNAGQSLQLSIQQAIDRSVDLGVPIAKTSVTSSVATMTTFPRITLNQSTCSQVISELVRCCADAMVYFDYSQATPSIQVTRRKAGLAVGSAATIAFNASTDPITSIDLNPMIELEVSKVDLPYLDRDTLGRYRFQNQSHGTASSPLPKRQIITVSGPELDTFLPAEYFDRQFVSKQTVRGWLAVNYAQLETFIDKHGFNPMGSTYPAGITASNIYYWSNGQGFTINNWNIPTSYVDVAGTPLDFGDNSDPPEWMVTDLKLRKAKLIGWIWGNHKKPTGQTEQWSDFHGLFSHDIWWQSGTQIYSGRPISDQINIWVCPPETISLIPNNLTGTCSGGRYISGALRAETILSSGLQIDDIYNGAIISAYLDGTTTFYDWVIVDYQGSTRKATVKLLNRNKDGDYPANGSPFTMNGNIIFRQADYLFIKPPNGMAQFLKECQDFVPYQGNIQLTQEDVGATRYTGKKIRISNSMTEYAAMDALVKSESLVVETGETTITLGQPDRFDYRTLVDRIRKTSQDNIYYTV